MIWRKIRRAENRLLFQYKEILKKYRIGKKYHMKLNVGCGTDFWGEVRVDVSRVREDWPGQSINAANVVADAQSLPFKNKVFCETRCFHVLEHLIDPRQALQEMKRVTKGRIELRFPVWHLYTYIIEAFYVFLCILRRRYRLALINLLKIFSWKSRFSNHKWYIKIMDAKVNKQFGIPKEYEFAFEEK